MQKEKAYEVRYLQPIKAQVPYGIISTLKYNYSRRIVTIRALGLPANKGLATPSSTQDATFLRCLS